MRVIGLISGTSMDGIDAAAIDIDRRDDRIAFDLLEFASTPYPDALRAKLDRTECWDALSLAQISSLNFELGDAFSNAALSMLRRVPDAALIGSHGQTVFHEPRPDAACGRVASTLQLAEPAVIAQRTELTTIADFRVTDVAAGGQGAPLVAFVDYLVMRSANESRTALNIGGIANVTFMPAGCAAQEVSAFDSGPGNMLLDRAVRTLYPNAATGFDRDGKIAASGSPNAPLLEWLLSEPYFSQAPPKTAGREQFGATFFARAHAKGSAMHCANNDFVATLTELSARAIVDSVPANCQLLVVSGGGVHNQALMRAIDRSLANRDHPPRITRSDEFGFPVDAKEAMAFAILAYEALHGRSNTLPSATGARRPAVMGKIVPGKNFISLMRSVM